MSNLLVNLVLLLESDCSGSIRCKRIRKSLGTDPLLDRQSWGSLPRLWRTTRWSRPSRRRCSSASFHFFHTRLIPAPDSPSFSGTSGPRWRRTEREWRTRGRRLKVFVLFQSSSIFAFPDLKQKFGDKIVLKFVFFEPWIIIVLITIMSESDEYALDWSIWWVPTETLW